MASTGLLPPNLSGVPCNFSFLTSCYKYRGFDQRFIRIQLLYTYLHSLTVKCFDSNAQHQLITQPAPLSGLHPLSGQSDARGLEIPSSLQLLWLVTHNALPKVGAGRCNFSYNSLSALVWGLTLSKKLFNNFIIAFQIIIATGQTFFKTPTFGNAKR